MTGLSNEEAAALAAAGVPRVLSEVGLAAALRSGLVKLGASLPALQRLASEHLRLRLHVDVAPWFHVPEEVAHLDVVRLAVLGALASPCAARMRVHRVVGNIRHRGYARPALAVKRGARGGAAPRRL